MNIINNIEQVTFLIILFPLVFITLCFFTNHIKHISILFLISFIGSIILIIINIIK
jgi:hypothetical protein